MMSLSTGKLWIEGLNATTGKLRRGFWGFQEKRVGTENRTELAGRHKNLHHRLSLVLLGLAGPYWLQNIKQSERVCALSIDVAQRKLRDSQLRRPYCCGVRYGERFTFQLRTPLPIHQRWQCGWRKNPDDAAGFHGGKGVSPLDVVCHACNHEICANAKRSGCARCNHSLRTIRCIPVLRCTKHPTRSGGA